MTLTYRKTANIFIWIFVFTLFGPVLGALQMVAFLSFYGGLNTFGILPIAVMYSMVFLVPALLTGIIMFILKKNINQVWHLLFFSLSGPLSAYVWSLFIAEEKAINNSQFDLLLVVVAYISTLLLSALFFHKSKTPEAKEV